jgi:hypothetical protein
MRTRKLDVHNPLYLETMESRALPGFALASTPFSLLAPFDGTLAEFSQVREGTLQDVLQLTAGLALDPQSDAAGRASPERIHSPLGVAEPAQALPMPIAQHNVLPLDALLNAVGESSPATDGISTKPQATYLFNDNLDPETSFAPPLTAVDPLGRNRFETATVYGQERRVYAFDGDDFPDENAGLKLATTGLVTPFHYSVEMVFQFQEGTSTYRRIIDARGRVSDYGLYVNPSNRLDVYPEFEESWLQFFTGNYHHVVMTNTAGAVQLYLDGWWQFWIPSTDVMHINNPGDLLYFFTDDESVWGEVSDGRIALLRLYEGTLSLEDVSLLAKNPFAYP